GTAPLARALRRRPGDLPLDRPRDSDVVDEPDHVRPDEGRSRGAKWLVELLDDLCLPLVEQHMSAPHGAYIERLVAGVQDQNLLHARPKVPTGPDYEERRVRGLTSPSRARPPPAPRARGRRRRVRGPAP